MEAKPLLSLWSNARSGDHVLCTAGPRIRLSRPSQWTVRGTAWLAAALLALTGCDQQQTSLVGTKSSPVPAIRQTTDFTLPDLAERPHTLAEYLARGPVLLVFFTTWCPYCRKAIPALKQIHADYGDGRLTVVAVNAGLADSLENARRYALEHRLPYPVLYDADGSVSARYGVQGVPRIFLIRGDGTVAASAMRVPHDAVDKLMEVDR